MVLEYLEGGSLESLLIRRRKRGECLQPYELLSMASEVAAGLAFLHRNSLIHRDVKSANVRSPLKVPSLHLLCPGADC